MENFKKRKNGKEKYELKQNSTRNTNDIPTQEICSFTNRREHQNRFFLTLFQVQLQKDLFQVSTHEFGHSEGCYES